MLQKAIQKATGEWGRSIAILLPSGFSAAKVSAAMNSAENPIRHKLLFDEAEAMLAARFAAFLLEPPQANSPFADLGLALDLYSEMKRASGVAEAKAVHDWAVKVRSGKIPRAGFVTALQSVLKDLKSEPMTGDPAKDWTKVRKALLASGDAKVTQIAKHLDYLVAFNRGKRIGRNLGEMWQRDGQYTEARRALELALTQDQLLDGIDDPNGVQVMTIHKAKGKQFDGVIVVREGRHDGKKYVSSFVWRGDVPPYYRSRKILHVAVTRAKVHTLILDPVYPICPILGPHRL
jgi:DNA helicase-2/ATP-dependent DNA helicase PcrA